LRGPRRSAFAAHLSVRTIENGEMTEAHDNPAENIQVVERFLAALNRRWPTQDELAALVAPDVVFIERPNLMNRAGSERDAAAMRAGIERGRQLLA
jgi:ketosteroid isomerase-like protein